MRKLAMAVVFLSALLLTGSAEPACAAYNVGVIDRNGREVIPCKYREIIFLGKGQFFAESINTKNPELKSFDGQILNGEGKALSIKLPVDCTLSKVILPKPLNAINEKISSASTAQLTLPEGTFLETHTSKGFGLCDLNGSVILEPEFSLIGIPKDGYFPVFSGDGFYNKTLKFTLDTKTGKRVTAPENLSVHEFIDDDWRPYYIESSGITHYGYIDKTGKVAIRPRFRSASEFSKEGLAPVGVMSNDPNGGTKEFFTYIDRSGKQVSRLYDSAQTFENGEAFVTWTDKLKVRHMILVDSNFKSVLPGEFNFARKLMDALYVVQRLQGEPYKAVNAKGEFLFDLPAGTTRFLRSVDEKIVCVVAPKGENGPSSEKRFVCIDREGKETNAGLNSYETPDFGFNVISKMMPCNEPLCEVKNQEGKTIVQPQLGRFIAVSPEYIMKTVRVEQFHPSSWRNPGDTLGINRYEQFALFLRSYDLIGMPKTKVEAVLGPPEMDSNKFWIHAGGGGCGNSGWNAIEIEYKDGAVQQWREIWTASEAQCSAPWVVTNVVVDPAAPDSNRKVSDASLRLRTKTVADRIVPNGETYQPSSTRESPTSGRSERH